MTKNANADSVETYKLPTRWDMFKEYYEDVIGRNGRLLTIFAVVLIIFTGYTIVENPSSWWVPVVIICGLFLAFFLFSEARGFVKAIGAVVLTILASSLSYLLGTVVDPYSNGAIIWFTSYWVMFLCCIGYSYLFIKGRSRWGSVSLATTSAFVGSYIVSFAFLNALWASLTTVIIGFLMFVFVYNFSRKSNYRQSKMPLPITDVTITESILTAADETEWFARSFINSKREDGHYLVWKNRAYLLVPIFMDDQFTIVGRRRSSGLGYKGKPINPWLVDIIFNRTPFWRSRGANIMVILLDLQNANGKTPRTIAVSVPDQRSKIPVGIMPAKGLEIGSEKTLHLIDQIDKEFRDNVKNLTQKHKDALIEIGIHSQSELDSNYDDSRSVSKDEETEDEHSHEDNTNTAQTAATDR